MNRKTFLKNLAAVGTLGLFATACVSHESVPETGVAKSPSPQSNPASIQEGDIIRVPSMQHQDFYVREVLGKEGWYCTCVGVENAPEIFIKSDVIVWRICNVVGNN